MIWRSSFNSKIAQILDFLTVIVALILSYFAWDYLHIKNVNIIPAPFLLSERLIIWIVLISFIFVFVLKNYGAYSYQRFTSLVTEYLNILKTSVIVILAVIIISYLLYYRIPRTALLLGFLFVVFLLFVEKSMLYYLANYIRQKGKNRKKILVLGTGKRTEKFINTVKRNFNWGLDLIGLITANEKKLGQHFYDYDVLGYYKNLPEIVKKYSPDELIITLSTRNFGVIREVLEICETEGLQVRLISDFFSKITKNLEFEELYGLRILSFNMTHKNDIQLLLKRIIDILGASFALLFFSPFMIIAMVGIWVTDGRPIFYSWNVVGYNKKPFKSWKFRTMVRNADKIKKELEKQNEMSGPVFKIKNDPRIIPFGRWLRKYSIDETPQLFSVLKGDMSLVGPRPAGPHELEKYQDWQRRKLSVKPGLTCLWQASGRNQINDFNQWVKLDLEYIDNWSLWLDIKILLKTIPSVVLGKGAS